MGRVDHLRKGACAVRLRRRQARHAGRAACLPILLASACAAPPQSANLALASRYPPFVSRPYEPFSRTAAVAIAMREWRLFGGLIDDDPPGSRAPLDPEAKPERLPGLWQRVGEYWWLGMPQDRMEGAWTGKHDANGIAFATNQDGDFPWSAAFISYVMRIAGAGGRFPYSALHADYINAAAVGAPGFALRAERPEAYAPAPGDLICMGRHGSQALRYDDLPAPPFPSHCDIVVVAEPGELTVIGGNVDDAVTMKHVPTTADGYLASSDGIVVDTRYPWFVAIQVLYDLEGPPPPSADRLRAATKYEA
jgi:hypothetical protein